MEAPVLVRTLLASLLIGAGAAAAAPISPVDLKSTGTSFPTSELNNLDSNCGAPRGGEPGVGFPYFGYSGADVISEDRINVEYRRADIVSGAQLKLFFEAEIDNGSFFPVCVHGYSGDGVVTAADFQLDDRLFFGVFDLGFLGDDISQGIDVSALLTLPGDFLGIHFSMDGFIDGNGRLSGISLVSEAPLPVPEPAPILLIGMGALFVVRRRAARR